MKRYWIVALVVVALLAGCGGARNTPAPAAAPTAAPAAAAQGGSSGVTVADKLPVKTVAAALATTPPEQAAEAPTAEPTADDSLSLASRETGLDQLKSYRMRWQAQWQGTDSGKTESSSWDWTEEYSSEPQALHFVWKVMNSASDKSETAWEVWQIGKTSYMATQGGTSDNGCISFSSDDKDQQFNKGLFSPSMLGSLHDAKFAGNETVNGIRTKHYTYDQSSTGLAGFGKVSGETWVAVDGGYVVKDVMRWEGGAGLFGVASGTSANGSGQWTWELSDVDQPIAIKAPDNCGGAANDLPLLADATEKSTFGDIISYKSATKLADAVAFYQDAMPAAGWQAAGEAQTTDEFATLGFGKDQQKAQIMITKDSDTIQVMITVTKEK